MGSDFGERNYGSSGQEEQEDEIPRTKWDPEFSERESLGVSCGIE